MAASSGTFDQKPMKRVGSMDLLPPDFSELRVAVLGNNWKKSCSIENVILGEEKFKTEEDQGRFLRSRTEIKDKAIFVISTPDFLHLDISDTEIQKQLCDLDPHVFLLVLHIDTFTEEHKLRLSRILQLFSDDSFEHLLIVMSTQSEVGLDEICRCHTHLYDMIKLCKYRYLREKNLEREELIVRLGLTAKKKSSDVMKEEDEGLAMKPFSKHDHLNLFLCGRREEDKTLAAKAILCPTELHPTAISPVCVQYNGKVAGYRLSLVTFSSVCGKPLEMVMKESLRCISHCDPHGIHAFILVVPAVPLTDEDKGELETIQNIFGPTVTDFTMIMAVEDDGKELCESSGDGHVVVYMRDQQQISEMLEHMTNKGSFTRDMFTQAQINKVFDLEKSLKVKAELEDVRRKHQIDDDVKDLSKEKKTKLEVISEIKEAMKREPTDELQTMRAKISELTKEVEQKEKQLKEECDKRRYEEKMWKTKEANWRLEQKNKTEALVRKETEQKESAEEKLRECQREIKKDREIWDKEKRELWEQKDLNCIQYLVEERCRYHKLRRDYRNGERMWKNSLLIMGVIFPCMLYIIFSWTVFGRFYLKSPFSPNYPF